MGKIEINNEIVQMRHAVRRARICVVHKLTREAKQLRTKRGNEKQQEKNKRKAGRLINEVYALKRIKDDQISKFGIFNAKSLQELLENPKTSENERIMIRLVNQKNLKRIIAQFKKSFPDYERYINPEEGEFIKVNEKSEKENIERRRSVSSKAKPSKVTSPKNGNFMQDESSTDKHAYTKEVEENNKDASEEKSNNISDSENNLRESNSESSYTSTKHLEDTDSKRKKRKKSLLTEDERKTKKNKDTFINEEEPKAKKSRTEDFTESEHDGTIKIISKEATVKRFGEILREVENNQEDNTCIEDVNSENTILEVEKEVDEFFMNEDGDKYLSIAVTASKEDSDVPSRKDPTFYNESNKRDAKHAFGNNKFFSNIETPVMPRYNARKNEYRGDDTPHLPKGKMQSQGQWKQNNSRKDTNRRDTQENKDLHPSWAAKIKQQEILKQGFQGKKIIFNDE